MTTHQSRGQVPDDLILCDPQGGPRLVREVLVAPWSVVQLVRYFGCLPCQEWLVNLDRAQTDLAERSASAAAVGGSADYQARYLQRERQVTLPLLLDPEQKFRDSVGSTRPLGIRLLDPRGVVAYGRSLVHGYRPQRITRDTVRSPGVVILDADLHVRWQHIGRRLGDYPTLAEVLAALDQLTRSL